MFLQKLKQPLWVIVGWIVAVIAAGALVYTNWRSPEPPPTPRESQNEEVAPSPTPELEPDFSGRTEPLVVTTSLTISYPPPMLRGRVVAFPNEVTRIRLSGRNGGYQSAVTIEPGGRNWYVATASIFMLGKNEFELTTFFKDGTSTTQTFTLEVTEPSVPVNLSYGTLEVDWLEHPVKIGIGTVTNDDALIAYNEELRNTYFDVFQNGQAYKTGTITTPPYDGDMLAIFTTGYCPEELGCDIRWYRVIKDRETGAVSYLPRHSEELLAIEARLVDRLLPNVRVSALEYPDRFVLNGLHFSYISMGFFSIEPELWFWDQELAPIATHPEHGTVYTTPPDAAGERTLSHAFYLRLPDNRVVAYRYPIPFMTDSVPNVTWTDGSENSADYSPADIGGCGAYNQYAVRAEDDLQPEASLVAAGTTSTGDTIYLLRDSEDEELREVYDRYLPYLQEGETRMSYEEFIARRPLFYWQDAFDRWIRFVRMDVLPQAECGKPVIYLYPPEETAVNVELGLKGALTVSEPAYGNGGWDVIARPDGYVVNRADGLVYPNLYWEGTGVDYVVPKKGFVVKRADADRWLAATLETIGFTERESREFREFWVPRLPQTPYVFITFVSQQYFDRDAPLRITPRPDVVYRIFMEYRGLEKPVTVAPLSLPKIVRKGFTVVEWGGALR